MSTERRQLEDSNYIARRFVLYSLALKVGCGRIVLASLIRLRNNQKMALSQRRELAEIASSKR
ncbi:hypothetical protein ASD54_14585 [Rhizobium sp. Root149]|jgi:hypothetical protein|nr:hypothetical protein ASD54_14585 [Rhizobium sp. Root149]KRA03898.1 hypothetical protein ASD74_23205 [Rhizobium sp. Root564]MCM0751042.1 hypothetical protein [Brucella pseudogrignonensis]